MTSRRALVPGLITLVALLLVAAGIVLLTRSGGGSGGDTSNGALTDQAETTQVIGQVSQALDQVLSYDYKKPQANEQAATQLLIGDAAAQYKTLFTALQSKADGQQLTLAASTVVAGVSDLTSDHADLLVFLNQKSTRASDQATSTSAAQVQISATKVDGDWKISGLLAL